MSHYLTVDEAATLLHVSQTTVRRWIYQGKVRANKIKTGKNGRVLIDRNDLISMLEPISPSHPHQSKAKRHKVVERILAFRKTYAFGGGDVDSLIDAHNQERERG